jgi:hypothetical protein
MCVNFVEHTAHVDSSRTLESNAKQRRLQYSAVSLRYKGTENDVLQCLHCFSYRTRERVMPLVNSASKQAFRKNVVAEAKSKPIKQAVAIAYSVQRKAAAKKK